MIIDLFYQYYRQAVKNVGTDPSNVYTFDDAAKILFGENYNKFSEKEMNHFKEQMIQDIVNSRNSINGK
jgi:hypothetical protein